MLIYIKELETKVKTTGCANNIKNLTVSFLLGCVSVASQIFSYSFIAPQNPAYAQSNIVPDNTLGSEASRVIPNFNNTPNELITGGVQRGQNLFHSFREFNVGENRGAYFLVFDPSIQNILARVTGSNRSEILGILGTIQALDNNFAPSNANLFIINPNGIIFGENARLNVGGSFVATTANEVQFNNLGSFSTSSGQPSQALTVNPSAFLFNQIASQPINSIESRAFLSVPESKSLLLLGGNISSKPTETGGILLSGGRLRASGGNIELGGLAGVGNVGLNFTGTGLTLKYPTDVPQIDVTLRDLAEVDVTSGGGGIIAINASNINVFDGSDICAGIGATDTCGSQAVNFGAIGRQAGNITLKAIETVNISGSGSTVENDVNPGAAGNAGDINIQAKSVFLSDGGFLRNNTFGQGNGGNIVISAQDSVSFNQGGIRSRVQQGGVGKGGNIRIFTGSLELLNGSQLSSATFGQGNAGNIVIEAPKGILIEGRVEDTRSAFSGVFSTAEDNAVGSGGNIDIQTSTLQMQNLAAISSDTEVTGDAGNINIRAQNITIIGGGAPFASTGIVSRVLFRGFGLGGNIDIDTGTLQLLNGAEISTGVVGVGISGDVRIKAQAITLAKTNSDEIIEELQGSRISSNLGVSGRLIGENDTVTRFGVGRAGNVDIKTETLTLRDEARINASTLGDGDAGNVSIIAKDIDFDDSSLLFSASFEFGNAGDINIETGSLRLSNGSQLLAFTEGRGIAGNIRITAKDTVEIQGSNLVGEPLPSALFTDNDTDSDGVGGNITVTAQRFRIADGAIVDARTRNQNKGGDVTINTNVFEAFRGGQIITTSQGSGKSGTIFINADQRLQIDGINPDYANRRAQFDNRVGAVDAASGLFVLSQANGSAGDIFVNTPNIQLDNGGKINAESNTTDGGNITLNVQNLLFLRRNSSISATAGIAQTTGNGGNININSKFIIAIPKENSDIKANAFEGNGGRVQINTQGIFGTEFRPQETNESDITASSRFGISGIVNINSFDDSAIRNNLNELPEDAINTNALIANSCIARRNQQNGSFFVTGSGGLPARPSDAPLPSYSTGDVQPVSTEETTKLSIQKRRWQIGDPVIEPSGVYELPNGKLALGKEC
ncbi:filamentous haemagglutinin outer membrane protein (plasmid) [Calothrix sp. PCC 7716]|nr:filamentous haemagglutinin outer membrane protein [Calothrix sp. PCC 7716]